MQALLQGLPGRTVHWPDFDGLLGKEDLCRGEYFGHWHVRALRSLPVVALSRQVERGHYGSDRPIFLAQCYLPSGERTAIGPPLDLQNNFGSPSAGPQEARVKRLRHHVGPDRLVRRDQCQRHGVTAKEEPRTVGHRRVDVFGQSPNRQRLAQSHPGTVTADPLRPNPCNLRRGAPCNLRRGAPIDDGPPNNRCMLDLVASLRGRTTVGQVTTTLADARFGRRRDVAVAAPSTGEGA